MEKDKEKYLNQKTEIINSINSNSSKECSSQNNNLDLKRFNSHEVYLVTQKKTQNNDNNNNKPSKGNKKIYLNLSKTNQDKIKPKSKRSFNTNSNTKEVKTEINNNKNMIIKTENNIFTKSKTKVTISPTNNVNSIRKTENIIKTSKILDEESIREIDSEGENTSSNKGKNYNENNKKEKDSLISNNNRIIKKINFDDIQTTNTQIDSKNRELLLISKKGDKEKLLELLSSKQININFQNENGWSALHFACDEGNLKIVDILIKSKVNLNLKTIEKKTALHISVLRGYFDISKLLIENGAKINLRDNEQNLPIHICASQGHDELLNFLLEKNSSGIKIKNLYGKTPLDLANKESTKEIIKKFLDIKKKNISDKKDNFSRIKIRKTNKDLMKCLMTPISPNALNDNDINNNNTLKKSNDTNTTSTLASSLTKPFNIKEKISSSSKKVFNTKNNNLKQNKKNKLKIEISSSNKTSIFYRKHLSNKNNAIKDINNTNINSHNYTENKRIINNNNKYLNTTSNKHKTIFNIHISCNNNGNKSPSPYRESNFHCNTSSNMTSSSKQIHNNNNKINNESKGNEIFFGEKEKKKGKIINIPKRINNKKEDRSQSKNKKMSLVWKTVNQTDRITPKFSPKNISFPFDSLFILLLLL